MRIDEGIDGDMDRRLFPYGDPGRADFADLISGLDMLRAEFDWLEEDFIGAASKLSGSHGLSPLLRSMMRFGAEHLQFGHKPALQIMAREESPGVPVDVLVGEDGRGVHSMTGLLVGLVGVRRAGRGEILIFDGVAAVQDEGEGFVVVGMYPDHDVWLDPAHGASRIFEVAVDDIYPPRRGGRKAR